MYGWSFANIKDMIPYSNDLREKIIRFFENHPDYTQQEIADEFGVSRSFIEKLLQRWRATHSSAVLPHGGGQQRTLKAHQEKLRELVAAQPAATLDELRAQIRSSTPLSVSSATMCRERQRLHVVRKESLTSQRNSNALKSRRNARSFALAPPTGSRKS